MLPVVHEHTHVIPKQEHPISRPRAGIRALRRVGLLLSVVTLQAAGCGRELMPTPTIWVDSNDDPFGKVPPPLRTSSVKVLYATDRDRAPTHEGLVDYGYGRSKSLAFGSCTVTIGRDLSWDDLVGESRLGRRSRRLELTVTSVHEMARFPEIPEPCMLVDTPQVTKDPKTEAAKEQARQTIREALRQSLSMTPRKEVFVFIHGVGNTFEYAAGTIAELWHFMGRIGVPVVYSWPAGYEKGMVQLYTYDRESGEFTVYHLKQFLRELAACPKLEKVHLISHSRGTDVLTTALRELNIEYTAAGKQTGKELKLGNLVLAAADLDFEVISQRLMAERIHLVPERIVVYVSQSDKAMSAADWLMASKGRLGQLRSSQLGEERERVLKATPRLEIVDVHLKGSGFGHSYFYENPAASSDLIRLLRDNCPAGTKNCRPLIRGADGIWDLYGDYGRSAARSD